MLIWVGVLTQDLIRLGCTLFPPSVLPVQCGLVSLSIQQCQGGAWRHFPSLGFFKQSAGFAWYTRILQGTTALGFMQGDQEVYV